MAGNNSTAPSPDSSSQPPPIPAAPPSDKNSSSSAPPPISSTPSPPSPKLASPPPRDDSPPAPSTGSKGKESPLTGTVHSPDQPKSLSQNSPPSLAGSDDKGNYRSRRSSKGHAAGASLGLVIGVAVGVGLFLVLMAFGFLICFTRRKKRERGHHAYYDNNPEGGKGGGYYNGERSVPRWQGGGERMAPQHMGGGGGRYQPPPPPLMMIMSGEMSTDAFSSPRGSALPPPPSPIGFTQFTFSYEELAEATDGFAESNLVGQGGFGYVFKGTLPNGKEVAIKQLRAGSGQGESEFRAEIEIITRVHHRHLVSLVGYCIQGQQRLLVYEFVPNQTLEYHLHGKRLTVMDWPTRVKIALGSAKGLAYLHEDCHPRIIHRDIKASNILLDINFEARVADFGLARPSSDTNTHVSTRVMGTFGYLAPEYASTGKLTEKSDVFSFGVMLLELITGQPPIDMTNMSDDSLVDWARPLLTEALANENFENLVDPRLENNYNVKEMTRMVASAAACIRHSARKRPKLSQILRALESDVSLDDLDDEKKPGHRKGFSSSSEESVSYASKMRQLRKNAVENDDFGSQQ